MHRSPPRLAPSDVTEGTFSPYSPYNTSLYEEYDYTIDDVEGALPDGLRGTLYRNGPGKLDAGGQQLGHLFDGDGMLSMFVMSDGTVRFRNRYVRTKHYEKSLASKGAPYRALGTMHPGGILANALRLPANVANTGVVMHAGKLLALWEGGRPTRIHPDTLDTLGAHDFDGGLKWLGAFSAHPKWDFATGDMFNFGLAMFPTPKLICYRVDRTGRLHRLGHVPLPRPMFNHDVGLTHHHMVFVIPPLVFPLRRSLEAGIGVRNFIDAIDFDATRGTMIALVPRDGGRSRILHTDPSLHLHLSNAYEDGEDTVVELVDYHSSWQELNGQLSLVPTLAQTATMPYGGQLTRLRITPSGHVSREPITDLYGEFPMLNVKTMASQNRYTYLSAALGGNIYPNAVAKIDNTTGKETVYRLPDGHLPHEAIFAAHPDGVDEDDGWLLVPVIDGVENIASLIILDAKDIEAGPVYQGRLRHHLPLTFHGCYTPRVAAPA